MSLWRDLLTESDNATFSFLRVATIVFSVTGIALAGWSVMVSGHEFDPNGFFLGAAALIAGAGVGVRAAGEVYRTKGGPNAECD